MAQGYGLVVRIAGDAAHETYPELDLLPVEEMVAWEARTWDWDGSRWQEE